MKKPYKSREKTIKELAVQLEEDFKKSLPITVLSNGSIIYKQFVIKPLGSGNWALVNSNSTNIIEEFYLKTTALMAARAYGRVDLNKFFEIKRMDNKYWACHSDLQVYKQNIKNAKDFDRFCILLNKLENSQAESDTYKEKISKMFKWTFA